MIHECPKSCPLESYVGKLVTKLRHLRAASILISHEVRNGAKSGGWKVWIKTIYYNSQDLQFWLYSVNMYGLAHSISEMSVTDKHLQLKNLSSKKFPSMVPLPCYHLVLTFNWFKAHQSYLFGKFQLSILFWKEVSSSLWKGRFGLSDYTLDKAKYWFCDHIFCLQSYSKVTCAHLIGLCKSCWTANDGAFDSHMQ